MDLRSQRLCPLQLFERAALVKAPFFALAPVGAVWIPRWSAGVPTGDTRLDSRFELYAEDPARAASVVTELTARLLAAPPFGLLEVVGSGGERGGDGVVSNQRNVAGAAPHPSVLGAPTAVL